MEIKQKRYSDQCIYLLYFLKKESIKISDLRKTTSICNVIVRWEYYTPKIRGPTQCSRCQDFGHGSENCNRIPKCIRCGDPHKSIECPHLPIPPVDSLGNELADYTPKIPVAKVKCANCNQNHTVNYRYCPSRETYIKIQQDARLNSSHKTKRAPFPIISDPKHFPPIHATASHSRSTNSWQNSRSYANVTNRNAHNGMMSTEECYEVMNEFIEKLSNCQNRQQQLQVIGQITFKYLYGSQY